jgi:hypothetical protein
MANLKGLRPEVLESLNELQRLVGDAGGRLRVNSAFRSREDQERLYANRGKNKYPVARPGTSKHESGHALDLQADGMTQEQLAKLASGVNLRWAGNKDRVHFDYDPKQVDPFQQALASVRQNKAQQRQQAARYEQYNAAGMPAAPVMDEAAAGRYDSYNAAGLGQAQAPEAERPGFLQRTKDYWSNKWDAIIHGRGPGGTDLHLTERIGEVIGLAADPIDFTLGGFATAMSGNPQGGALKWGVMKPLNALGAAAGQIGRGVVGQISQGPAAGVDWRSLPDWLKAGFNEQVSGTNFITETIKGSPSGRQWVESGGDAWTKWADFGAGLLIGPKGAKPLAPVFRYGGKAVRIGTDAFAAGLDRFAGAIDSPALARRINRVSTGFKELTNATPEYRQVQELTNTKLQDVSAARQRLTRVINISKNIGRKLRGDENATLYGDLLSYHPDEAIRSKASNPGYLPSQIILHGAEAGTEGAFFTHRAQVLSIAADLGLPVKALDQAITELQSVSRGGGERMVASGLMDDATFQQNAGHWIKRIYRTNLDDQTAREVLLGEMVEAGIDSTRANNLVAALQATGVSGPAEVVGAGLKTVGNKAKQFARRLTDVEDRLEFMPEYNAIDQVANSMLGQYKASAIHEVFKAMAGDEALSAANKIKNYSGGRKLDFSQTPRIQGMLKETLEQIKLHQARLTEKLETEYNARRKWVDDQDAAVRSAEKRYTKHVTSEPLKPVEPTAPAAGPVDKVSDVLTVGEAAVFKPKLSGVLQDIGQQQAKGAFEKAHEAYVKELADWQPKHQAWQKRTGDLAEQLRASRAELAKREKFFAETDTEVGKWFDEAERLERKHDLLRGAEPTDLHANDALAAAEEKLGFQIADPAERQQWYQAWKNAWQSRGIDIFDMKNETPPIAPKGVPQSLVDKVDQNIIPAVALDDTLSAPAGAFSLGEQPPGWTLWEGKGNRSYGAMEGRWGPEVIRRFVEDAIDPNRFERGQHPVFGFLKAMSDQYKALKLYYNPATKYGIEVQSFWEAKATVNAAGVRFNPRRYIEGMKEYKKWIEGDGPETPAVRAMQQGVRETGAGYMTAMNPEDLPNVGKEGPIRRFASANRQKFIEVQQYPKAGTAAVLIDAGFSPAEAGTMAERGFGARGGMGGIETHGVMQIAEGLNKYGIAIFTSYPLHSINRFLQLMAHKPEVLMTYPIVRQYMLNEAGPEARGRADREEVRPTMVPIPGLKGPNGDPVWIDVQNLIPHGGDTADIRIGGPLSPLDNPLRRAYDAGQTLLRQGAAPDIAADAQMRQGYFAAAPSIIGSGADAMLRALSGQTRSPGAVNPESPLMAAGRLVGFPMQHSENALDRRTELEKVAQPGRVEFYDLYIERVMDGRERPEDYSAHVKQFDLQSAYGAQGAAQRYLSQLLADKSIDADRAKTMIRRQVDWIISINAHIQTQHNQFAAQQAQEVQDAEEADQYSQAGAGAGF